MNIVKKLSDNTKSYIDNFYQILDEMADRMRSVPTCNSISKMYILQMIPHHEAGVKMSENILNFTTDTEIEELAKNIISSKTQEILRMEDMLACCEEVENNARDISIYQREFQNIFENMIKRMSNAQTGNNLNVDFLSEMIPHHEGEINMTKNVLRYEICSELKQLAEEIIANETAQTEQMKSLLRRKM